MKFKHNVSLSYSGNKVTQKCIEGMMKAAIVYREVGISDDRAVITSVCDGRHRQGSKHYTGDAFDLRTWSDNKGTQMTDHFKEYLAKNLRAELGTDYDVVVESTHIHVEYDPKG